MKYDFTSIMKREGQDALAVDIVGQWEGIAPKPPKEGFDFIPMWVADMNFPIAPVITEAIRARAAMPHFGYFFPREEYYDSIINWQKCGNGVTGLLREHIGYENGVHGCLASAMEVYTKPGDAVFLHSPAYLGFIEDLELAGRKAIFSNLKVDADGVWRMDYDDMDKKLRENHVHFAIFCSPHNPTGRVWEKDEITKAMELFEKNSCVVLSDEIWADIVYKEHRHIPTQSVGDWAKENTIAVYAPSKTFNLAGLIGSYHIIYNDTIRDRVRAYSRTTHYNEMNVLSQHALMAAYSNEGREWLGELLEVLYENCLYGYEFVQDRFDGVTAAMPQGTYMLLLDCTDYCKRAEKSLDDVIEAGWKVGVGWQDGRKFDAPCHIRMNLALPLSRVREAFDRLEKYVFT